MPPDARIEELLARYPDQLTDDELDELRAAAEADPEVDELMDAIHQVEAGLADLPAPELSQLGERRLDRLVEEAKSWSTGGSTPEAKVDADEATVESEEAKGWSTGGSTPEAKVVDLGARRRWLQWVKANPAPMALAAMMLLAAGFMLRDQLQPPDEFTWRGDDDTSDPDRIEGELWVMGEARIEDGEARPVNRPITFRAVMSEPASLVLVETQSGRSFVIWPEPGQSWQAAAGSNLLQPGGVAATYLPATSGEATYTLLASRPEAPIPVPPGRETASAEALLEGMEGTWLLGRTTIVWEVAE